MYLFQSQDQSNSMDLPILIIQVIGAFFFLFIACEFGGRMTIAHGEIDSAILQLSWYNFPVELKMILPVVISIAHQEVELKGFGSVVCSRETFQKVSLSIKYSKRKIIN